MNNDSFEEYNMLGNGYDWQTVVCAFPEKYMAQLKGTFDCEADTFLCKWFSSRCDENHLAL